MPTPRNPWKDLKFTEAAIAWLTDLAALPALPAPAKGRGRTLPARRPMALPGAAGGVYKHQPLEAATRRSGALQIRMLIVFWEFFICQYLLLLTSHCDHSDSCN